MRIKQFVFLLFGLFLANKNFGQNYEITVQLNGLRSKTIGLGYFYGNQQFQTDTARVDTTSGLAVFRGNRKLPEGMYFMIADGQKLLDCMVDGDQNFKLSGDINQPDSLAVEGSAENLAFFEHKKAISELLKNLETSRQMLDFIQKATKNKEVLDEYRDRLTGIYKEINQITKTHVAENPSFLYTKMLKMGFTPVVPSEIPMRVDGNTNFAYVNWLKAHYFDNIDFTDTRLLYCNVFQDRINGFFRGFYPETADSVAAACDFVLRKTAVGAPEFHQWTTVFLTELFENSTWQMGANVFVHLVDRWQQPKQQPWLDDATQMRLQYKADTWRPTLVGNAVPRLILADTLGKMTDLLSVDAPVTMLIFYSPLCEHCQELMPKIYPIHQFYAEKGLKTVAVSTEVPAEFWRDFIKKEGWNWLNLIDTEKESATQKTFATFNLPVIYLLDKNKKIVGRRMKFEELEIALEGLLKNQK